jgi:hypothetical protein
MRTTTIKTMTASAALFTALLVGSVAGPAAAKTIATGGGQVNTASFDSGVTNKLNAMLDELPNAGVGRPGR